RAAHRALAPQRGHAHGSATAQHGERSFHDFAFLFLLLSPSCFILRWFVRPCFIWRFSSAVVSSGVFSPNPGSRRRPRLRRTGQCVRHFHIRHAQFVEAVLQEVFFRGGEVVLGL